MQRRYIQRERHYVLEFFDISAISISQDFTNYQDDLSSDDTFWFPVIIYNIYTKLFL